MDSILSMMIVVVDYLVVVMVVVISELEHIEEVNTVERVFMDHVLVG